MSAQQVMVVIYGLTNQMGSSTTITSRTERAEMFVEGLSSDDQDILLFLLLCGVLITSTWLVHQTQSCSGTAALVGDGRRVSQCDPVQRIKPIERVGYPNLLLRSIFSDSELVSSELRQKKCCLDPPKGVKDEKSTLTAKGNVQRTFPKDQLM